MDMANASSKTGVWVITVIVVLGLLGYGINDAMTKEAEWKKQQAAEAQKAGDPAASNGDKPAQGEEKGPPKPPQPELLKVGTAAPDFTVKELNGKTYSLKDFHGKKKVLLEFFSSRCPHCQHSVEVLNTIEENFKDEVKLLAVNAGDDHKKGESTTALFQKTFHTNYTIVEVPSQDLGKKYHLRGFPTSYLIDEKGKILWVNEGTLTSKTMIEFEKAVDAMPQQDEGTAQ
jgi:peroxiredoxin